jgi:hypothetical protein
MSTDDNIFVAADRTVEDLRMWLGESLEFEAVDDAGSRTAYCGSARRHGLLRGRCI